MSKNVEELCVVRKTFLWGNHKNTHQLIVLVLYRPTPDQFFAFSLITTKTHNVNRNENHTASAQTKDRDEMRTSIIVIVIVFQTLIFLIDIFVISLVWKKYRYHANFVYADFLFTAWAIYTSCWNGMIHARVCVGVCQCVRKWVRGDKKLFRSFNLLIWIF